MSTEQRDIRAIGTSPAIEGLLHGATLWVGDVELARDERLVLEEDVFLNTSVSLDLGTREQLDIALVKAQAELKPLNLALEHLEFVVTLSSGYLKICELRHRMPLSDLSTVGPRLKLSEPPRPLGLRSPRAGCTIEASIYVASQRPSHPLRPWRMGSWLARSTWSLVTDHGFGGFTPKPMDAQKKKEFGLPPSAVRYVVVPEEATMELGSTEEQVELWIDADLLARISLNPKSKPARLLQLQFFVDTVAAVVDAATRAPSFSALSWKDLEDTLLGRVIALIAPNGSSEAARTQACSNALDRLKEDRQAFIAHVEGATELLAAYRTELDG